MQYYQRNLVREDFLEIFPKKSVGAELGVFKGQFSKKILQVVKPGKLYLFDGWWVEYGGNYPNIGEYTNYGKIKTKAAYEAMLGNIDKYSDICEVHIGSHLELLSPYSNKYFDWIYLDLSLKLTIAEKELEVICSKIKSDGLLAIYNRRPIEAINKSIIEYGRTSNWKIIYVDEHNQWCLKNIQSF